MTPRRADGPLAPRVSPPDLPTIFDTSRLERGIDVLQARIEDLESVTDAAHATITECSLSPGSAIERLALEGAVLVDVEVTDLRVTAIHARGSRWRRVRMTGGRVGTLDLAQAELDEVELRGIRIDYLSLGGATVRDVVIVDCTIGTLDVPQATLTRVAVTGSTAGEVDSHGLRAEHVDLRGLEALAFTDPLALRGVTLASRQLELLAPSFGQALGIDVRD